MNCCCLLLPANATAAEPQQSSSQLRGTPSHKGGRILRKDANPTAVSPYRTNWLCSVLASLTLLAKLSRTLIHLALSTFVSRRVYPLHGLRLVHRLPPRPTDRGGLQENRWQQVLEVATRASVTPPLHRSLTERFSSGSRSTERSRGTPLSA